MTLLQRSAPDEVLARVFGVLESVLLLTVGLGAVVAPLLLSWLGTRGTLIVAGSLLPVASSVGRFASTVTMLPYGLLSTG